LPVRWLTTKNYGERGEKDLSRYDRCVERALTIMLISLKGLSTARKLWQVSCRRRIGRCSSELPELVLVCCPLFRVLGAAHFYEVK
jgi:hypothetical protein